MDKYNLPVCRTLFSDRVEIPKVYEAVLPEYCHNIQRILKSDATASVESTSCTDGFLRANIRLNVHILYSSEPKGHQKTVCFPFDFEHTFDASRIGPDSTNLICEVNTFVVASNAKQKSPRSMEIKLNICVAANIYDCSEIPLISPEDNPDVELRTKSCTAAKRIFLSHTPEKHREDITLDAQMPPVADISDYSCRLVMENVNVSEGMLSYNGNAIFKCTYRAEGGSDDASAEYIYLTKEIPLSGEIASEHIYSGCIASGRLVLSDVEIDSSFDPYGENRIINVTIGYETVFDVFDEDEILYADDGYCTSYICDLKKNYYTCDSIQGTISDKAEISEKISAERASVAQVTDSFIEMNITGTDISEGKLYVSGKASACIMGCDEKGEPCCVQTSFGIRYPVESVKDATPERKYFVNPQIVSDSAVLRDGEITLSATVQTDGVVLNSSRIEAIFQADISYDSPKPLCHSEYIIYYPESGETLWDIAKKYEISEKEILSANESSSGGNTARKTVIIPCREI